MGETDAFCLLAQAYERRIYSLAFHYCRDPADAEDLSQDVWLKAYAAISSFRFESGFYTWLRKIMINCFLNHRRSKSFNWRGEDKTAIDDYEANETGAHERPAAAAMEFTIDNRLVVEKVMQALSEVSSQQRLIFLLKHREGMTYDEIAREIGCSTGTVKKSVSRTVSRLRQQLGVDHESKNYISCAATGILS
jgi:RNA polymerase sigma-70 factor (ECF subfamily)